MSDLKNIFYGDRVVQQAYLNDALIYQADSWTNTPVTKQKVYTMNGIYNASLMGITALFNSNNELFILDYRRNDNFNTVIRIAKFNADNGTIKYSLTTNIKPILLTQSTWNGTTCISNIPAYIDKQDVIHVVYNPTTIRDSIHLLNITDTGTGFSIEDGVVPPELVNGSVCSVCYDDNNFYVAYAHCVTAVDYKCSTRKILTSTTDYTIINMAVNTDSKYLYGMDTNKNILQFDKSTGSSIKLNIPISTTAYNCMTIDKMNNIYLYNTNYYDDNAHRVYKYSPINGTFSSVNYSSTSLSLTIKLCFDSRNNIYTLTPDYNAALSGRGLYGYRFNASGATDWAATDFITKGNSTFPYGDVCVDNYDSIYYIVGTDNSSTVSTGYEIYKYNNLEQVQNS